MTKKIRILSFDADGCLFNKTYIELVKSGIRDKNNVIKCNKDFLDEIKKENEAFDIVYTIIGSSRQSQSVDKKNSPLKGSFFPAIKTINKYLNTNLDKFLLADIYGDLESGTSFERAVSKNYNDDHSTWTFDETKATIIFAQIQKIANDNPDDEIVFDFYDDRRYILHSLKKFYTKFPKLIPKNVTLHLHQYAGYDCNSFAEIEGKGEIDRDYRKTVIEMADNALKNMLYYSGMVKVAEFLDITTLKGGVFQNETKLEQAFNTVVNFISSDKTKSSKTYSPKKMMSDNSQLLFSPTASPGNHRISKECNKSTYKNTGLYSNSK